MQNTRLACGHAAKYHLKDVIDVCIEEDTHVTK